MPIAFAAVLRPLLHEYDVPPLAVRVVELAGQNAGVPAIAIVGAASAATAIEEVATQPDAFVTETV